MDLGERLVESLKRRLEADRRVQLAVLQSGSEIQARARDGIEEVEEGKRRMQRCKEALTAAIASGRELLQALQEHQNRVAADHYPLEMLKAEQQEGWVVVTVSNFESWAFSKVWVRGDLKGKGQAWLSEVSVEPGLGAFQIPLEMHPVEDTTLYIQLLSGRAEPPVALSAAFDLKLTAEPASLPRELPPLPAI